MKIDKLIETEIESYKSDKPEIISGYRFSQYEIVRRIVKFQGRYYPTGQTDSQGNYKFWYDIITPRVNNEIKNIDFDTKNIEFISEGTNDSTQVFLANLALGDWLRNNGQAEELNNAVEANSVWGNVVWKKIKDGYERVDLTNFYVINQTAKSLDNSPAIERHVLTQSDLRKKRDVWNDVDEVIENCGSKVIAMADKDSVKESKETFYYEIFERNGEISERALREAQGKDGGDENKFVLAKIIVAGLTTDKKNFKDGGSFILFADTLKDSPYKESHRGNYQGRWFRKGLYETLFDLQVRANEIGNQLARGLEWSSKTVFQSSDELIVQNVLTDLTNGDIIKTQDLKQVDIRMHGISELIADWNRIMNIADKLSNSFEVISGESLPSGTPFRLGALLNQNANKFYDFVREKLALSLESVFNDWIAPKLLKDLKTVDVLRLTGDSKYFTRFLQLLVDNWYNSNLVAFPPHSQAQAQLLKETKLAEIQTQPQTKIKMMKDVMKDFKTRAVIIITGEGVNADVEVQTLSTFIPLETDPVRRQAMIEIAMRKKNLDVGSLPKSEPAILQQQQNQPANKEEPVIV